MTRLEPWFSSVGKDHSAIGWLKWMESSDGLVGHGLTKAIDVPSDFTNRKLSYFLSSSTVPRPNIFNEPASRIILPKSGIFGKSLLRNDCWDYIILNLSMTWES